MTESEVIEELKNLEIKVKHQPKQQYPYTAHISKTAKQYKQVAYGHSLQDVVNSLFDDGFISRKIVICQ